MLQTPPRANLWMGPERYYSVVVTSPRPLTAIPPCESTLVQKIKRVSYQGGHVWGTADRLDYSPPPPEEYGWVQENGCLKPLWLTLSHIWDACRELDRCGCASDCSTRRCFCRKHQFPCSPARKKCKGECSNAS